MTLSAFMALRNGVGSDAAESAHEKALKTQPANRQNKNNPRISIPGKLDALDELSL